MRSSPRPCRISGSRTKTQRGRAAERQPVVESSTTHIVLIPSYNPGPKVFETVAAARRCWQPVWIVVDGSTDGTGAQLARLAESDRGVRVFVLPRNRGKGAAVLSGVREALAQGFTHAL